MVLPFVSVTSTGLAVQPAAPARQEAVLAVLRKSSPPRLDEKSPARSASEGTVAVAAVMPRVMRRCSCEKKKKVLSRPLEVALAGPSPNLGMATGPLEVPPKLW